MTFRDEDGVDRPTVAGLRPPGSNRPNSFPSGSIEAACYRGTRLSSDDLSHAERLAGPVSNQIDAGIVFVACFMQAPSDQGPNSGDVVPHDLDVADEAIVNAATHGDYAISGSKICLFLYAARLELLVVISDSEVTRVHFPLTIGIHLEVSLHEIDIQLSAPRIDHLAGILGTKISQT